MAATGRPEGAILAIEMFDIGVQFGTVGPACGNSAVSFGLAHPRVWEGSETH